MDSDLLLDVPDPIVSPAIPKNPELDPAALAKLVVAQTIKNVKIKCRKEIIGTPGYKIERLSLKLHCLWLLAQD